MSCKLPRNALIIKILFKTEIMIFEVIFGKSPTILQI